MAMWNEVGHEIRDANLAGYVIGLLSHPRNGFLVQVSTLMDEGPALSLMCPTDLELPNTIRQAVHELRVTKHLMRPVLS